MTTTRPASVDITRVLDPHLPPAVLHPVAMACDEGFDWVGALPRSWTDGPFVCSGEALLLATIGDVPAGIATITEDHHLRDGRTGRLRYVYTAPSARRSGVADLLLRQCLIIAGDRWTTIRLHTQNDQAARLYARYGFQRDFDDPRSTHFLSGHAVLRSNS